MKGIGGHQSARAITDEWLTPPEIIHSLGEFDLDPCSPVNRPWDTAKTHYSDYGLLKDWFGRVWLNPPYGRHIDDWMDRLSLYGNGIALIFARTETEMFFRCVWGRADAVLFIKGRLFFYTVDGVQAKSNSGAPSVLVAYGDNNVSALEGSGIEGKFIKL